MLRHNNICFCSIKITQIYCKLFEFYVFFLINLVKQLIKKIIDEITTT